MTGALGRFGVLVGTRRRGRSRAWRSWRFAPPTRWAGLAQAFNQMVARLRELMRNVAESSEVSCLAAGQELTKASEQSAAGAREAAAVVAQMAGAAGNQAKVAGDVRTTMKELQSAIEQIAQAAQRSAGEVQRSVERLGAVSERYRAGDRAAPWR